MPSIAANAVHAAMPLAAVPTNPDPSAAIGGKHVVEMTLGAKDSP
jgi:hypothetical protein